MVKLRIKEIDSDINQLFPLFFLLVTILYLLALHSNKSQAPSLTFLFINYILIKEDEVLQKNGLSEQPQI